MPDRLDAEAIFLKHLAWIEEVAAIVCRRNTVWGDDADDFVSSARAKLMENDYAVICKFRGDAEMKTYLARVVTLHFMERARERTGRWRPSAAAEAHGQIAKDLEALVYRDGCTLAEAGERLRTMGRTTHSDAELARLLNQLPMRHPMRPGDAGAEPLEKLAGGRGADQAIVEDEADAARACVLAALNDAMDQLSPDDQALVRMHLADGRTVADAARALRLDQKALYRRLPRLKSMLRERMERAGVTAAQVRETLQRGSTDDAE
jgi:RNA polymerase sigma factor for flagellar operon FliA